MATYLERQVEDWQKRGVIDATVAGRLRADLASANDVVSGGQKRGFSLFQVLAGFAGLAFAAGVLLFIAANWNEIPRLVKVAGIAVLIFVGMVGGAMIRQRAQGKAASASFKRYAPFLEELLYALGGAAYVGGVALVGQMYHLPGDMQEAMFGFALGLTAAALAVRSRTLTLGALFCAAGWYVYSDAPENLLSLSFALFLAIVGICFLVALLRDDRRLRWVCFLALAVGLAPFVSEVVEVIVDIYQSLPVIVRAIFWHAVLLSAVGFLWVWRHRAGVIENRALLRRIGVGPSFTIGLAAIAALHILFGNSLLLLLALVYGIAFAVFTLFIHGAQHRRVRYLSYALFLGEVFILFGDTIIGMLNSSAVLFVVSGVLAALAFVFYRVEKRFAGAAAAVVEKETGDE